MPTRPKQFKPNHRANAGLKDHRKRERDMFYSGKTWRRVREQFLMANPLCLSCLEQGREVAAKVAHHVVERLHDPEQSLSYENLQALCNACHTALHDAKRRSPDGNTSKSA